MLERFDRLRGSLSGSLVLHAVGLVALLWGASLGSVKSPKPGEVLGKAHHSSQERLTFSILPRLNPQTETASSGQHSESRFVEPILGIPFAASRPDLFVLPSRPKSAFARAVTVHGDGTFSQSDILSETKKIFRHQRATDFLATLIDTLQQTFPEKSSVQCVFKAAFFCAPTLAQLQAYLNSHSALLTEYRIQTVELVRDTEGSWTLRDFSLSEELP